jgi:murein DD-endopeptidase MepM/ murein hydrolase activator NlpD
MAAAVGVLLATPGAHGQSLYDKQQHLDGKISSLRSQIDQAKEKEGILSTEIQAASSDISSLESDIGVLTGTLASLESELAAARARLAALEERFDRQTDHLNRLRKDFTAAQETLDNRLVDLYTAGETDTVALILGVTSLSELIEQIDFVNEIGLQDQRIAAELKRLKGEMREARIETGRIRDQVADETATIAAKTEEARAAQAALVARQSALESARADKQSLLANVTEEREHNEEDLDELQAASAQLAAQIQAAQAASSASGGSSGSGGSGGSGAAPSSGFVWPTSGVVTSGFGPRWGRMHEGIDIAAPTGTSVRAVAAGTVIYAGVMGGYGNIVVIDHGNGLSTAYAHLSAIWAGGGGVSQGQGIGAVGCTGSCTGPHLHFEVRVNGAAVDPMGYL